MSDMSDIEVTLTFDQIEEIVRQELRSTIHNNKKEINTLERCNVDPEHEDLVYSKQLVKAAAVILKYYSVPDDWEELDAISNEQ